LQAEGEPGPGNNLSVIQRLAGSVAEEVAASFPSQDSAGALVALAPRDYGWTLEIEVGEAFRRHGYRVVQAAESARVAVDLGIADAGVSYSNPRRDGLFGTKVVDRSIRLTIRGKVVDLRSESILLMKDVSRDTTDVVPLDEIERLQTQGIPMTRGEPPPEGFFDSWLEPLILIGAIAVGVYLLFTMRS
jgi:hypothetical protein